jgi:thymidylate synthase ThyX
MTKEIQKYADIAMFKAAPIDSDTGPQVQLLSCNNDPLGTIASAALMYEGKYVESLAEITDTQRRYYLEQVQKSALAAPLEFVNFHFLISGVTRGFTHQMVRQRTATYTQESTRFAVKEDVPVGLPPSLDGTIPWEQWVTACKAELYPSGLGSDQSLAWERIRQIDVYAEEHANKEQIWRREWDWTVEKISQQYNDLVNSGMPAEDARGLLPTNLLTRINYNTSLRGLLEHSGVRLCTQAQFEWRLVWTKIKEAIVDYGIEQTYRLNESAFGPDMCLPPANYVGDGDRGYTTISSLWQFEELSKIFKPICYQKGSCQFNADVDRACKIKGRVEQFASLGIPSTKWGPDRPPQPNPGEHWVIAHIDDSEWMMDPSAARVSQ